jgi:nucleotide-binding universal stress UspA family protein
MTTGRAGPVVVGVDYSGASEIAVAHAAWQAHRRGLELRLTHGLLVPVPSVTPMTPYYDANALLAAAEERIAEVSEPVRTRYPELPISIRVVPGFGGKALVDDSETASLVVVGSRGQGGFLGVLLGSVAAQVSTYAHCPVLVVRQQAGAEPTAEPTAEPMAGPETGPVVVGIDGSVRSADALRFAADEAGARGVPLIAVHVWSVPQLTALSVGIVWSQNLNTARTQLQDAAARILAEATAGWREQYPGIEIRRRTVHGDEPARTLLSIATEAGAGLIVVAARGRGGVAGMLLGSVSQTLVAHAAMSVAVIHPAAGFGTNVPRSRSAGSVLPSL